LLTIQNKDKTTHSINLLHTARDDAIYSMFNTQSGPVHLSCPPERRRLSLLLTGEQPVQESKGFSRVIFYLWATAGGCEMFLVRSFVVLAVKYAMNAPVWPQCWRDRIARPVQNGNWHSRLAQCVCDTNCTSLAQILLLHTVVGTLLCYTLLQDCNHDHTWHIATVQAL